VHPLAQKILEYIRREDLLQPGNRVGVAVSGGADSVGLLRLLLELKGELGVVLSVVHLNHKLRGSESDADAAFVRDLAQAHALKFYSRDENVAQHAAQEHISIETAARQFRYAYFEELLTAGPGSDYQDKIATGHTLDDQAETVLLRIIRGTGMRGLRAIQPKIQLQDAEEQPCGEIVRPLLPIRRHEIEHYLGSVGQPWREDATNADPKFTRNRVRHVLLPLLETEFNPAVSESLAELAEIAREEEDYWDGEVAGWLGTAVQFSPPEWMKQLQPNPGESLVQIQNPTAPLPSEDLSRRAEEPGAAVANASISLGWFLSEPMAVQRRVIKAVAETLQLPLEFKHIDATIRFATEAGGAGRRLALPLGWSVVRERDALVLVTPDLRIQERVPDYEYRLSVPGRVVVPETLSVFEAVELPSGEASGYDPEEAFAPALIGKELRVRNWRPGDRFWPAHTKAPKKVKELLQEKHISGWQKRSWPVVLSGDEIVWVRGFPGRAQFRPDEGRDSVLIRETPLDAEP